MSGPRRGPGLLPGQVQWRWPPRVRPGVVQVRSGSGPAPSARHGGGFLRIDDGNLILLSRTPLLCPCVSCPGVVSCRVVSTAGHDFLGRACALHNTVLYFSYSSTHPHCRPRSTSCNRRTIPTRHVPPSAAVGLRCLYVLYYIGAVPSRPDCTHAFRFPCPAAGRCTAPRGPMHCMQHPPLPFFLLHSHCHRSPCCLHTGRFNSLSPPPFPVTTRPSAPSVRTWPWSLKTHRHPIRSLQTSSSLFFC